MSDPAREGNGGPQTVSIGPRLRRARAARRLSLADVAVRAGLTKSFLSRVERDETSPSVGSLLRICDAVGMRAEQLFATPTTRLVRAGERPSLDGLPGASVVDTLITPVSERHLTVLESVASPGGSGGAQLYSMPSECEVCFVLEGTAELVLDEGSYVLEAGDALTFGAGTPHTWRNTSDTAGLRLLWILAPALPDPRPR